VHARLSSDLEKTCIEAKEDTKTDVFSFFMAKSDRECETRASVSDLRFKLDRESETRDRVSDLRFKSDRESETRASVSDLQFKSDRENEIREIVPDLTIKPSENTKVISLFYFCPFRNGRYSGEVPSLNEMYFSF